MKKWLSKEYLRTGSTALGGMVIGALVGILVQVGIESTGMLGPSVDALLSEQQSNFDEVNARLESLKNATDDSELGRELEQLAALLTRQDELRRQAGAQLSTLSGEVASLRGRALDEQGFAGGADVWLGVGESISVGDTRNVFGITYMWQSAVDVNLNGQKSRLQPGDSVDTGQCLVFLKQSRRENDNRAGFDVTCS